eukprot:SAG11_NODE_9756_length_882_cov_15.851852_1_plen_97_part_01
MPAQQTLQTMLGTTVKKRKRPSAASAKAASGGLALPSDGRLPAAAGWAGVAEGMALLAQNAEHRSALSRRSATAEDGTEDAKTRAAAAAALHTEMRG